MNTPPRPYAVLLLLWILSPLTSIQADAVEAVSLADPAITGPDLASADSWVLDMTPDGRHVVFVSRAANLIETQDRPRFLNVYARDRVEGTMHLVSVNRDGTGGGNGESNGARLSADGRYVVFESVADDLVRGDGNGAKDIFLRDLVDERTELISVNAAGTGSGNGMSWWPVLTPDGGHVIFLSHASDLVAEDLNGLEDVFVRSVKGGTTSRVSVGPSFQYPAPFRELSSPFMSSDGRYVGFTALTELGALMPQGKGLVRTIIGRDMEEERMIWVAENVPALVGSATVRSYNPVISEDGSHVVFKEEGGRILRYHVESRTTEVIATNAVVNGFTIEDTSGPVMTPDGRFLVYAGWYFVNSPSQIYRWDAESGETVLISVNREGSGPGNGISDTPWVSADGRYVTFLSHATDLVEGELDRISKLYVRDVEMGTTRMLSVAEDGEPGVHDLVWPFVSTHAEVTVFDVPDDRYVAGDVNRMFDVFGIQFGEEAADLLSVGLPGTRSVTAFGPSHVGQGSLSADGRYVAFVSQSDDLVSNDANGLSDVFVRDLVTGQTILVSVNQDGTGSGNGMSTAPTISADGRFVAFQSMASDLVDHDDNDRNDVFVRDLLNGTTTLISVNRLGTGSAKRGATEAVISADGRHVAFLSASPDLVIPVPERNNVFVRDLELGETKLAGRDWPDWFSWNGCDQVVLAADGSFVLFRAVESWRQPLFRSDLETGITERVDQPMAGRTDPNSFYSMGAFLSNDGRWVTFLSTHTTLAPEAANGLRQVFLRDLETGTTQLISVSIHGAAGNGAATETMVSDDGRWVAFVSAAGNLVPNDPNRLPDGSAPLTRYERDVFLRDVEQGRTMLVSRSGSRDQSGDGRSEQMSLSADGRYVAYSSWANDLVAGGQMKQKDVYVFDRATGLNTLRSVNDAGSGAGWGSSHRPVLSADGRVIVFKSYADDLIALDHNDAADVVWARVDGPGGLNSFFADIRATAAETVTVRWRGEEGLNYQVEYRDTIQAGEWEPLPAVVEVNDGWAWVVDVLPVGVKERYYRVTLAPGE
jgi:Tol biopolymer transport system component